MSQFEIFEFHEFIRQGDITIVKQILDTGVNVNAKKNNDGLTALHVASEYGQLGIITLLLDNGAKVNKLGGKSNDSTPLMLATENYQKSSVKLLLDRGGEIITETNSSLMTMLHVAAVAGDEDLFIKLLVSGLDLEQQTKDGLNALHFAARCGNKEIVEILLKNGAKLDSTYDSHEQLLCVLHSAALGGSIEIVKILLNKGCEIDVKDEYGNTTLHFAARGGHPEMIEFVIQQGIKIDVENDFGQTVLFSAVQGFGPNEGVVKLLLNLGLDINYEDFKRNTPLSYIAQLSDAPMRSKYMGFVETLLKHGAGVNTRNKDDNCTLFELCYGVLDKRAISLVLRYGANVNSKNYGGETALHIVMKNLNHNYPERCIQVVKKLIKYGADVMAKDKNGQTLLSYALKEGCADKGCYTVDDYFGRLAGPRKIVELLLGLGVKVDKVGEMLYLMLVPLFSPACTEPFMDHGYTFDNNFITPKGIIYWLATLEKKKLHAKVAIRQIFKMKCQNLNVYDENLRVIQSNSELKDFWNKCDEEVNRMKDHHDIFNLFVSKNSTVLGNLASKKEVVQVFASNQHKTMFPIYAEYLKEQLEKGLNWELTSLLRKVKYFFPAVAKSKGNAHLPKLPARCTAKINDYLSIEDLKTLAFVCNPQGNS